jgi:hypothetical protein
VLCLKEADKETTGRKKELINFSLDRTLKISFAMPKQWGNLMLLAQKLSRLIRLFLHGLSSLFR